MLSSECIVAFFQHLNLKNPATDTQEIDEITCPGCMCKYGFLQFYAKALAGGSAGENGLSDKPDVKKVGILLFIVFFLLFLNV